MSIQSVNTAILALICKPVFDCVVKNHKNISEFPAN